MSTHTTFGMSVSRRLATALLAGCLALSLGACGGGADDAGTESTEGLGPASQLQVDPLIGIDFESNVVALSRTAADVWVLAGAQPTAVTDDALDLPGLAEDVQNLGPLEALDASTLLETKPDMIITSADAPLSEAQREAVEAAGVPVFDVRLQSFDDFDYVMSEMCVATGYQDRYESVVTNQAARIDEVIEHSYQADRGSFVALRLTADGQSAAGEDDFVSAMLVDLGMANACEASREVTLDDLAKMDPDWVFVVYEEGAAEGREYFASLQSDPAWQQLGAVSAGHVVALPPSLFSYPPDARWLEAYSYLSQHLHGSLA